MSDSRSDRIQRIFTLGGLFLLIIFAAGCAAMVTGVPGSGGETTISGTVYDSEGEPLESQTMRLSGDNLEQVTQTETSESGLFGLFGNPGVYEFTDLQDGVYTVSIVDSEYDYEPRSAQPGDTVNFGGPAASDTGDESTQADTETEDESTQTDISGTVNKAPDGPLPVATKITLSSGDEVIRTAFADDGQVDGESDDGAEIDRFSGTTSFTDILHDEYTVEVTADGHEPDSQAIAVSEDTEEFELDLIEHSSLTLTVVDEFDTNQMLEGATITLSNEDGEETESGSSGAGGQFTTDSLVPQLYRVSVSIEGYEDAEVKIELEPGEDREDEVIALTPEST